MVRRKPFRKCVIKEMDLGLTRKEATMKCKRKFKKPKRDEK
jgi:hypothetical protein